MDKHYIKLSKLITLALRHKPEALNLSMDKHGWVSVKELINHVSELYDFDMRMLEYIVANDNKQRFSFNEDKTKIRANQGHSIDVDVELEECTPPDVLYHGTGEKSTESISKSGLKPMSRLYVHLSSDANTALNVGSRHGTPVVYVVDTKSMVQDEIKFYKSKNNVWLTKYVHPKYLQRLYS